MPRRPIPTICTQGRCYTYTMHHLSRELLGTIWSTRGWTYQEAILSSRCLVFTRFQTHLVCKELMYQEVSQFSRHAILVNTGYRREPFLVDPFDTWWKLFVKSSVERSGAPSVEALHIEHFSQRDLGYDVDGLNAIKGILATFPSHTYWGLLLRPADVGRTPAIDASSCCRCAFAYSLAWKALNDSDKPSRRRKCFPSWSWPSLVSKIRTHGESDDPVLDRHFEASMECPVIQLELLPNFWLHVEELNRRAAALPKVIDASCFGLKITTRWFTVQIRPTPGWRFPSQEASVSS